jgi:hypothetical protein
MRVEAHHTAVLFGGLLVSFYNVQVFGLIEVIEDPIDR